MKKHLTLQPMLFMLFGLSLVALIASCRHFLLPGTASGQPLTWINELIETRRQDDDLDDRVAALDQSTQTARPEQTHSASVSGARFTHTSNHALAVHRTLPAESRRLKIQRWVRSAMVAAIVPTPSYHLTHDLHRLGGWKDANRQYRAMAERPFFSTFSPLTA